MEIVMTEELFLKYEEVRKSGKYNMFAEGGNAMKAMKLNPRHKSDVNLYLDILYNYNDYAKKWL